VAVGNLHLVDAAQIHAAVASFRYVDVEREPEIGELLICAEISKASSLLSRYVRRRFIDQYILFHAPAILDAGPEQAPTAQVAAVQERDRRAELHLRQVRPRWQRRDALAGERFAVEAAAIGARRRAREGERVAARGAGDRLCQLLRANHFTGRILPLERAHTGDGERAVLHNHVGERQHAATAPEDAAVVPPVTIDHLQPPRTPVRQRQRPATE